jgi:signal transduction histidine kinase
MQTSLDHLIAKAQQITAELRPPLLDNLGLAAAIEWQAGEFERRSGIECHLMLNEGIDVSDQQTATSIMRIFQETLTNIIRHARAKVVSISLCEREDNIILEISDNGCGITIQEIDSSTAYGIMGMRDRAHLCQGELTIKGIPEEGTTVCLTIPQHSLKENS